VRLKDFSSKGAGHSAAPVSLYPGHVQHAKLRALLLPWAGSSLERRTAEPEQHDAVAHG